MTVFDLFFFSIFTFYKKRFKQKANTIALIYISLLQITLIFALGCFFAAFFNQMNVDAMSSDKAWIVFILVSIGIHFKNWIQYNGKTRKVLNAKFNKRKSPEHSIVLLWVLPFACLSLALIILQSL